jgi:hypothetical protein
MSTTPGDHHPAGRSPRGFVGDTPVLRPLGEGELREHVHRILGRVLQMNLTERLVRVGPGHYAVAAAATRGAHVVKGPPRWQYPWELVCDCKEALPQGPRGRTWPLCIHVGAVLLARWRSQGYVVTVGAEGRVLVSQDACDLGLPPQEYPALVRGVPEREAAG